MASITVIYSIVLIVAIADAPVLIYFEFLDLLNIDRRFAPISGEVSLDGGVPPGAAAGGEWGDSGLTS